MSCGTLDVSDDKAAPMPSVIITAGSVQHISVEILVTKATVGAAVSRKASFALLILRLSGRDKFGAVFARNLSCGIPRFFYQLHNLFIAKLAALA